MTFMASGRPLLQDTASAYPLETKRQATSPPVSRVRDTERWGVEGA